ncbi:MAG TPA: GDSL-type esterase/lipase family protein, partial [Anaerolineae bacterium]|nr:GDSL-type esterase/lipase family protein [Anaerolineae bacterium]
ESVAEAERWPVQLTSRLRAEQIDLDEPIIIAKTGWATDELNAAIDQLEPSSQYDLVSLLIGVNNQYRGYSADGYRSEFATLLKRAIGFAADRPARVIVLSIPDWGVTPFAAGRARAKIAAEIDRFNAINRAETIRSGAQYIDITPISRRASIDPALIANDGLHPSGKMYTHWTELAMPIAQQILKEGL